MGYSKRACRPAVRAAQRTYQNARRIYGRQHQVDRGPESYNRAKIIVWAHNGHIAHGGMPSYATMGSYLRKMFGLQYVNFGFAFNKGSFQAIESGKGLRDFSIGPAPDGSLDATLASAGLPIMALDLRTPPKQAVVADWLKAAEMIYHPIGVNQESKRRHSGGSARVAMSRLS